jgi:hypothetical protein
VGTTPDSDPEFDPHTPNSPNASPPPVPPHQYSSQPLRRSDFVALRVLTGFFGYLLVTLVWFVAGAKREVPLAKTVAVWSAVTAGLLGVALYLNRRHGCAGYGYGILLSLLVGSVVIGGVVLLVAGLCAGLRH